MKKYSYIFISLIFCLMFLGGCTSKKTVASSNTNITLTEYGKNHSLVKESTSNDKNIPNKLKTLENNLKETNITPDISEPMYKILVKSLSNETYYYFYGSENAWLHNNSIAVLVEIKKTTSSNKKNGMYYYRGDINDIISIFDKFK